MPSTDASARTTDLLPHLSSARTLCDLLLAVAADHEDRVAFRSYLDGVEWTYGQVMARVGAVATRLRSLGVGHGVPIALMLRNRPEFHVVDAAAMMLGAVPFSVYNTSAPEQICHVLSDAGPRLVITESLFLPALQAARELGASYDHLLVIDRAGEGFMDLAVELVSEETDFDFRTAADVQPDDLLTLIYTSGTTGPPKGVELTHAGMLAQLRGLHTAMPLPSGGRQVSFLPAAHIADRWTSHYSAFMTYANTVTCVADGEKLQAAVLETKPTVFLAVPRIWEKFKASIEAAYPSCRGEGATDPETAATIRGQLGLADALWLVTGAAPTPPSVIEFFVGLGLPLCEGLGMSEASCVVTANTPGSLRSGSVGRPLETVEVSLAEDGELLIRGPQVMRGYRGQPERTTEAIDADKWLHTGDVARIDEDGFVWIVDRKKELIINSAGKNMSPANIEMAIRSAGNMIAHACVIGDARPYNVALLVLDPAYAGPHDAGDPSIERRVREQIDRANTTLSRVERIKKFLVLSQEWRPDVELTPTGKLRRRIIHEIYTTEVDNLYANN